MSNAPGIRERILDAAETVLRRDGALRLTQPEVARLAGVRQSHLTYYFPRRTDLLAALATSFLDRTAASLDTLEREAAPGRDATLATIALVTRLIAEPDSMRAFLALIVEADQDAQLRALLDMRMREFTALIAGHLGRSETDPDVHLLLAAIRGFGLSNLLLGRSDAEQGVALGERLGFLSSRDRP